MVKLRQLLGNRREVYYECMYTKHKTQKRKIWHDGFVALHDSRRLVLYEESPPDGTVLDEAKMTPNQWERMDEEYISVPKFFIEILNETPIQIGDVSSQSSSMGTAPTPVAPPVPVRSGGLSRGPSSVNRGPANAKFKSPLTLNATATPPPSSSATPYRSSYSNHSAPPVVRKANAANTLDSFDFNRNPTLEWEYTANSITRTPDEVAALWFGDELFE